MARIVGHQTFTHKPSTLALSCFPLSIPFNTPLPPSPNHSPSVALKLSPTHRSNTFPSRGTNLTLNGFGCITILVGVLLHSIVSNSGTLVASAVGWMWKARMSRVKMTYSSRFARWAPAHICLCFSRSGGKGGDGKGVSGGKGEWRQVRMLGTRGIGEEKTRGGRMRLDSLEFRRHSRSAVFRHRPHRHA